MSREDIRNLTVVIPCFNAGNRVRSVVEETLKIVRDVVLVDDGSTDGALDSLRELNVRLVSFPQNLGKGYALLAGARAALENPNTEAVCFLDADGQHDPAEISLMYQAWAREGADMVIGARSLDRRQMPWRSRFGNRITAAATAFVLRRSLPDTQCGFRIIGRSFCTEVLQSVRGGRYETEMEIIVKAIQENRRLVSVPIATRYEPGNASSHFRKFRDSFRIYGRFLATAAKHRARARK